MPYFVYKIKSPLDLEYIEATQDYRSARTLVRALREGHPVEDEAQFRMVFANDRREAHRLLSIPRDERVIGED